MNSDFGNKKVFSENLKRYVELSGKTRRDIVADLKMKESSFNGWCRGECYPRIDNIEILADYFGCTKSDLIEHNSEVYVMSEKAKKTITAINTHAKKELIDFISNCTDKEANLLMLFVKTMKGSEDNE